VTLSRLVLRNLRGSLFRSGAIFLCAVLVAALGLSATLIVRGANAALRRNLSRLGADIVVIPWGTMSQDFDSAHLVGMMTKRWMPRVYIESIRAVQGVEAVSPQLYLSTIADSPFCTLPELHLVAYEPDTDFVLRPWLEHNPVGRLRLGEAVGGSAVFDPDGDDKIHLHGYPLRLIANLEETGGDVDQTVFVSFDTAQTIIELVQSEPRPAFEIMPESISTAMIKVRLGSNVHDVAVRILEQVSGVVPLESAGLFQTQRTQIVGLLRTILILLGLTWLLSMLFVGLVFSLAAHERRTQIATLRALGATSDMVLKTLLLEGIALALAGGLAGTGLVVFAVGFLGKPIARATGIQIVLPPPLLLLALAVAALALAVVSVIVGAWVPARGISRQEPALAMRE
jgi:putative ABC transport system permease protein